MHLHPFIESIQVSDVHMPREGEQEFPVEITAQDTFGNVHVLGSFKVQEYMEKLKEVKNYGYPFMDLGGTPYQENSMKLAQKLLDEYNATFNWKDYLEKLRKEEQEFQRKWGHKFKEWGFKGFESQFKDSNFYEKAHEKYENFKQEKTYTKRPEPEPQPTKAEAKMSYEELHTEYLKHVKLMNSKSVIDSKDGMVTIEDVAKLKRLKKLLKDKKSN